MKKKLQKTTPLKNNKCNKIGVQSEILIRYVHLSTVRLIRITIDIKLISLKISPVHFIGLTKRWHQVWIKIIFILQIILYETEEYNFIHMNLIAIQKTFPFFLKYTKIYSI